MLKNDLPIKLLGELLIYILFVWTLFILSNSTKHKNSFSYQLLLRKNFNSQPKENIFKRIKRREDIYKWISYHVNETFYKNEDGFLSETSFLITNPVIRQQRVKKETCITNRVLSNSFICGYDFSSYNQLKSDFDFKWKQLNKSVLQESSLVKSFSFIDSKKLESYPFSGQYGTYSHGGYFYIVNSTRQNILLDLKTLEENNWIDNFTRAISIEFSTFNPNLNVYCHCFILFEVLPTGNFINSAYFRPLILINPSKNLLFYICGIIYFVGISILFLKEIFIIYKEKINYLKKFSILIDWSLIIFSCIALGIFFLRHDSEKSVIQNITAKQYVNLYMLGFWTDKLDICLGYCSFLGIVKFLALFRLNKKIFNFCQIFKSNFKEIFYCCLIFILILSAFVQIFYLLLNDKLRGYSTFKDSLISSFKVILGKVDKQLNGNFISFLVPIISFFYYVMISLISINIFRAIIVKNYLKIEADENEFKCSNFIKNKLKKYSIPVYQEFEDGLFGRLEQKVSDSIRENYYLQKY